MIGKGVCESESELYNSDDSQYFWSTKPAIFSELPGPRLIAIVLFVSGQNWLLSPWYKSFDNYISIPVQQNSALIHVENIWNFAKCKNTGDSNCQHVSAVFYIAVSSIRHSLKNIWFLQKKLQHYSIHCDDPILIGLLICSSVFIGW